MERKPMDSLEQRFDEVAAKVKALPSEGPAQPSSELKLELYGLYRQARDGDVEGRRPSPFDLVGRFKYDAWSSHKGMAREEAMRQYISTVENFAKEKGVEI
jgi:acyl-CoA-binding protein